MRKAFSLIFLVPLAIVLVLLSVANRAPTQFSLDPLNSQAPALAFELPLFVLLFLALMLGLVIGSFLTWTRQGKYRRALREKSYEASQLQREKETDVKSGSNIKSAEIAPGLPLISQS
ncbi:MAG: lipopolysaccharide assembly protein LapA domain-containing protein [Rhizobiaceae bacterium]|nr:lipopolysaccharide assembly protein LapA domain-containing protein [Rhizobiaceae bacterium]